MSHRPARTLSAGRKLLLAFAVVLAIAAPILAGAFQSAPKVADARLLLRMSTAPIYTSVSITPSTGGSDRVVLMFSPEQFVSKNATLQQVVRTAYGMEDDRIFNAPAWLTTEKYDFVATAGSETSAKGLEESARDQRIMLQVALADHLKLAAHEVTREVRVYALVIGKGGPKIKTSVSESSDSGSSNPGDSLAKRNGVHIEGDALVARGIPIDALIFHLSKQLHRTVLNETGLSGNYDFTLKSPDGVPIGIDNASPPASYLPALSAALEDQLGLSLEPRESKMQVLVIDHVEKPSTSQSEVRAPANAPKYEEVSIKLDEKGTDSLRTGNGVIHQRMHPIPGEFHGENNSLREMIRMAYGIEN